MNSLINSLDHSLEYKIKNKVKNSKVKRKVKEKHYKLDILARFLKISEDCFWLNDISTFFVFTRTVKFQTCPFPTVTDLSLEKNFRQYWSDDSVMIWQELEGGVRRQARLVVIFDVTIDLFFPRSEKWKKRMKERRALSASIKVQLEWRECPLYLKPTPTRDSLPVR